MSGDEKVVEQYLFYNWQFLFLYCFTIPIAIHQWIEQSEFNPISVTVTICPRRPTPQLPDRCRGAPRFPKSDGRVAVGSGSGLNYSIGFVLERKVSYVVVRGQGGTLGLRGTPNRCWFHPQRNFQFAKRISASSRNGRSNCLPRWEAGAGESEVLNLDNPPEEIHSTCSINHGGLMGVEHLRANSRLVLRRKVKSFVLAVNCKVGTEFNSCLLVWSLGRLAREEWHVVK